MPEIKRQHEEELMKMRERKELLPDPDWARDVWPEVKRQMVIPLMQVGHGQRAPGPRPAVCAQTHRPPGVTRSSRPAPAPSRRIITLTVIPAGKFVTGAGL